MRLAEPGMAGRSSRGARGTGVVQAWCCLIAGLLITLFAVRATKSAVDAAAEKEFELVCSEIRLRIQDRMRAHEQILRSGAAFFEHGGIRRADWRQFANRQELPQKLPGIQGFGFSLLIPRAELPAHLRTIRAEGFPAYAVRPPGDRPFYTSIIYLEPFADRNLRAFGYDMLSEPIRREAMERARDTDSAALSGKVILVQETDKAVQAGTLMYVPVYHKDQGHDTLAQRRGALLGWVYSPYRMTDLMQGIMGGRDVANYRRVRLQVFDGDRVDTGAILFDSHAGQRRSQDRDAYPVLTNSLRSAGRPWVVRFSGIGNWTLAADTGKVWLVACAGVITSVLLSWLAFSLLSTRYRAWQIADKLTAELRQSEEKHRHLVENSHDIIYTSTPEGLLTFLSPSWTALLGHRVADALGVSMERFVHPEDWSEWSGWLQRTVGGGEGREGIEYRMRHSSGAWNWHTSSAVPLRDDAGLVVGIEGTASDITERRRAEEALRASEEWFRHQFQDSKDALLVLDETGITDLNRAAMSLFGCTDRGAMIGRHLHTFSPETQPDGSASADAAQRRLETAYGTGGCAFEWVHQRLDGTTFAADVLLSRIRVADRPALAITVRDVTERLQAEDALREREARYRRLAEENERLLRQSSDDAAAKDRLLHEVNHRVKNNLSAIMGLMELELVHGQGGREADPLWTQRLDDLRCRVRSLAIAHGHLASTNWAPAFLTELVGKVVEAAFIVLPATRRRSVTVEPSEVLVSSKQASALALIVNELATNSIKHALSDEQELCVRIEVVEADGDLCMVYRDNGPGFPEDVLRGARTSVGLDVVGMLAKHDLQGEIGLSNDGGAVARIYLGTTAGRRSLPAD